MKITRIKIEGKYNLKHVDIGFSKKNNALVVGPNGWGKTNIVRCVTTAVENASYACERPYFDKQSDELGMKSFVKLDFVLNKDETCTILLWRLIFVTERIFRLCEILAMANSNEKRKVYNPPNKIREVEKFWVDVFPRLLTILAKACQSLDEFVNSKTEPDIVVSSTGVRSMTTIIELMGMKLPDHSIEEFDIIASFFKEAFGEEILNEMQEFPRMPDLRKPNDVEEEKESRNNSIKNHIENILNHKMFLRLAGFQTRMPINNEPTIYRRGLRLLSRNWIQGCDVSFVPEFNKDHGVKRETFEMTLEKLKKIDDDTNKETLGLVIKKFIEEESVCVLSQDCETQGRRGSVLFWSMENAQKAIIAAYLSALGSISRKKLEKVDNAMRVIANIELHTQADDNLTPPYVVFRNCGKASSWKLREASSGEKQLFLVLTALYLSGRNTVFLDEPGQSLHPPKQAQLRRWLEAKKDDNQSLFVITHAADMLSVYWLEGLYHMYSDDGLFSTASLNAVVSRTNDNAEPPRKKRHISGDSDKIKLDSKLIDFLMGVEMRRLFFSSGTVFVDGVSDKQLIEALRLVELDQLNKKMKNPGDLSIKEKASAHWDTQMDQWDIICMGGSANWLKAYQAASNLRVPFLMVLDADVLNKKSGLSIAPITYADWMESRLRRAVNRDVNGDHPLLKMLDNVDAITRSKTEESPENLVREELKKHDLWVWQERDIESVLFDDEAVRNALSKNQSFEVEMQQIGIPFANATDMSDRSHGSMTKNVLKTSTIYECQAKFIELFDELKDEFQKVVENEAKSPGSDRDALHKLKQNILSKARSANQCLVNYENFVKQSKKVEQQKQSDMRADVDFLQVKKKLHDGCWKSITSEALQNWIEVALRIKKDHPLHLLWEHIRKMRSDERENTKLSQHIMEEMFSSLA